MVFMTKTEQEQFAGPHEAFLLTSWTKTERVAERLLDTQKQVPACSNFGNKLWRTGKLKIL